MIWGKMALACSIERRYCSERANFRENKCEREIKFFSFLMKSVHGWQINRETLDRARELAEQKYGAEAWLRKR